MPMGWGVVSRLLPLPPPPPPARGRLEVVFPRSHFYVLKLR